jgi:hypothetical protein
VPSGEPEVRWKLVEASLGSALFQLDERRFNRLVEELRTDLPEGAFSELDGRLLAAKGTLAVFLDRDEVEFDRGLSQIADGAAMLETGGFAASAAEIVYVAAAQALTSGRLDEAEAF